MSSVPFLLPSIKGSALWPTATRVPSVVRIHVNTRGGGLTGEAQMAAVNQVQGSVGRIRQAYIGFSQMAALGTQQFTSRTFNFGNGVTGRFTQNGTQETLDVLVDMDAVFGPPPPENAGPPVLVTSGWQIIFKAGWLDFDANVLVDDPRHLPVNFEDSENCGGPNNNIQTVELKQKFTALRGDWRITIDSYDGLAELQNDGFERLYVNYLADIPEGQRPSFWAPGGYALLAQSRGLGLECAMGRPTFELDADLPLYYDLPQGESVYLWVYTTTGDQLYHRKAFYDLTLNWTVTGAPT